MSNAAKNTYISPLTIPKPFSEKQAGGVGPFSFLTKMAEMDTAYFAQNAVYEQRIVNEAGVFLQPAYKLSHVPERTVETNRSYLESYFERKYLATPLRSAHAVSSAVRALGETNEEYYRQSASRVR
jgi:hypothetical protein